ncbi:hypothetical protein [Aurantivibrio plasticivorans]
MKIIATIVFLGMLAGCGESSNSSSTNTGSIDSFDEKEISGSVQKSSKVEGGDILTIDGKQYYFYEGQIGSSCASAPSQITIIFSSNRVHGAYEVEDILEC